MGSDLRPGAPAHPPDCAAGLCFLSAGLAPATFLQASLSCFVLTLNLAKA